MPDEGHSTWAAIRLAPGVFMMLCEPLTRSVFAPIPSSGPCAKHLDEPDQQPASSGQPPIGCNTSRFHLTAIIFDHARSLKGLRP